MVHLLWAQLLPRRNTGFVQTTGKVLTQLTQMQTPSAMGNNPLLCVAIKVKSPLRHIHPYLPTYIHTHTGHFIRNPCTPARSRNYLKSAHRAATSRERMIVQV